MFEVVCAGISCVDILAKPVNSMPDKGKLNLVDQIQMHLGGCASNASIDLAKIGIRTALVGKVGNDGFGRFLKDTVSSYNINIDGLETAENVPTSSSVVMISDDGERSIIHCLGSNAALCFNDMKLDIISNSKILFIAGTFLMPNFDGSGTEELLKFARQHGVMTCMDTAWDSTGQWMKKIENSMNYLDWFMPSYEEAVMLSGMSNPEDISQAFIQKGVKNVVIKLGEKGCYVKTQNNEEFYMPAYKDINVIDTSGAGDSFCAGFLTGLVKEWDIKKTAKFANAVGAHCVMEIGTTTGVKSLEEILEFLRQRD